MEGVFLLFKDDGMHKNEEEKSLIIEGVFYGFGQTVTDID